MFNKKMYLADFAAKEEAATRDGFGKALLQLGKTDPNVVVLCADLAESTRTLAFKEAYPDRYVELGVAEQNLATVASGLAVYGKIPFIASYAAFSPGRNNEQIRTTIALNEVPVKIAGMHSGISVGPDGATHQALEDLALMRVIPNMTVLYPSDSEEARKATLASVKVNGPVYIRLAREKTPAVTTSHSPFAIGKAYTLYDNEKPAVAIFATGTLVFNALKAAQNLAKEFPVVVVSFPTIKPLDEKAIIQTSLRVGGIVTVEEHQVHCGFGSAVSEVLAQHNPTPVEFIGVHNRFGQSGETKELYEEYGLTVAHIMGAARKIAHKTQFRKMNVHHHGKR